MLLFLFLLPSENREGPRTYENALAHHHPSIRPSTRDRRLSSSSIATTTTTRKKKKKRVDLNFFFFLFHLKKQNKRNARFLGQKKNKENSFELVDERWWPRLYYAISTPPPCYFHFVRQIMTGVFARLTICKINLPSSAQTIKIKRCWLPLATRHLPHLVSLVLSPVTLSKRFGFIFDIDATLTRCCVRGWR